MKSRHEIEQTNSLLKSFKSKKESSSQLKKEQSSFMIQLLLRESSLLDKDQGRSEIRPPTSNQLRNQMMTYLKHVGNFNISDLKSKKFEDNTSNESKVEVKEEDEGEENTRKRKHGTRKKMKSRKRRYIQDTSQDDSSNIEKENEELKLCLTIAPDEDREVDYEILDKKSPIIDWKTESLGTKPQFDESKRLKEINLNVVTRSNGQKRYFSTLMTVLSVFDREDLDAVYKLVMDIYQYKIPEGFDKVIWGDLIVMLNPDEQDEFWNSQHEWKVISWKLHSSSGVHTLMTEEGLVIHMLIEKKYPLKKEIVVQMLKLKLESEEESTMALELIRFIKKLFMAFLVVLVEADATLEFAIAAQGGRRVSLASATSTNEMEPTVVDGHGTETTTIGGGNGQAKHEEVAAKGETGKIFRGNFYDRHGRTILIMKPGLQPNQTTGPHDGKRNSKSATRPGRNCVCGTHEIILRCAGSSSTKENAEFIVDDILDKPGAQNQMEWQSPVAFDFCQDVEQESVTKNNSPLNSYKNDTERSTCSGHFKKCDIPRFGGSILQLIEELIKVGQTMGYNMEGCITSIGDIINSQGANDGNR
ncbi:hypothetical protein Tco_1145304 [Tanacetum coccineum]